MLIPLKSLRKNFNILDESVKIENFLDIQKESYYLFLNKSQSVEIKGLHKVLTDIFPIESTIFPKNREIKLTYQDYFIGTSKLDIKDAKQQGITLSTPIVLKVGVYLKDNKDRADGKEKNKYYFLDSYLLYLNNIPLMTFKGTFIINGIEKTLINQLQRSPGIYYTKTEDFYTDQLQLIPFHGSWINIELDKQDNLFICLNKRIYLPIILYLFALKLDKEEILLTFFNSLVFRKVKGSFINYINYSSLIGKKVVRDIKDYRTGQIVGYKGTYINAEFITNLKSTNYLNNVLGVNNLGNYLSDGHVAIGVLDNKVKKELSFISEEDILDKSKEVFHKYHKIIILNKKEFKEKNNWKLKFIKELISSNNISSEKAKILIYKLMEPNNTNLTNKEKVFFEDTFFNKRYYDLGSVGREVFNNKFGLSIKESTLSIQDILWLIKHFFNLKNNYLDFSSTEVNELPNKRIKSTIDLLETLYYENLKVIKLSAIQKLKNLNVKHLHNRNNIVNIFDFTSLRLNCQYFFNTSSLSQFVDQVNILSEITNKRRITLLGSEGLSQESTTLDNRDIYTSYYGRICPIETPEGHNVGLVNTFSIYAKLHKNGLISTPYKRIKNNSYKNEINYLSSNTEVYKKIGQYNEIFDGYGILQNEYIYSRKGQSYDMLPSININFIDASSKQTLSVSSSLIPFLEHNDANRALMGANMQRQAVPLIYNEYPIVGTGIEGALIKKSNYNSISNNSQKVAHINNDNVVTIDYNSSLLANRSRFDKYTFDLGINKIYKFINLYKISKFESTNQNTLNHYKAVSKTASITKRNEALIEGISSKREDLSLGTNLLAAYMSFGGNSFEDSIVISEEVLKKGLLTSIHTHVFDILESRTQEEIEIFTKKVPSLTDKQLKHLTNDGVVKLGTLVKQNDILVGKVKLTFDNRRSTKEDFDNINDLLGNIKDNGKLTYNTLDSSYRLPKSKEGFVTKISKFYKKNNINEPLKAINKKSLIDKYQVAIQIYNHFIYKTLYSLMSYYTKKEESYFSKRYTDQDLVTTPSKSWWVKINQFKNIYEEDLITFSKLLKLLDFFKNIERRNLNNNSFLVQEKEDKVIKKTSLNHIKHLTALPLRLVRIEVTYKHHLKPGDKITGRYGNKGIISQVLPVEDMPYLVDGTPVEIILNPISISSRMNFGQILETHLSWASVNIGKQIELLLSRCKDSSYQDVKTLIYSIYNLNKQKSFLKNMKTDDFQNSTSLFTEGVPVTINSFNSPNEKQINDFIKFANLNSDGQAFLRDGKTGELFRRKITVGYLYTLKLNHFIDNKIHARSIGPYNLISKQPLIGKAQSGGQRFGEMEVWALQGYGAAYTLQEILTVKSDSYSAKEALTHIISENQEDLDKIIPQSFHLLVRELWSLGLFVDLY